MNNLIVTYKLTRFIGQAAFVVMVYIVTTTLILIPGKVPLASMILDNIGLLVFGSLHIYFSGQLRKNLQSFGNPIIETTAVRRAFKASGGIFYTSLFFALFYTYSFFAGDSEASILAIVIQVTIFIMSIRLRKDIRQEIGNPGSKKEELYDVLGTSQKIGVKVKRFLILIGVAIGLLILAAAIYSLFLKKDQGNAPKVDSNTGFWGGSESEILCQGAECFGPLPGIDDL